MTHIVNRTLSVAGVAAILSVFPKAASTDLTFAALRQKVDLLEAETRELEERLTPGAEQSPGIPNVVRTPFEVQDRQGKPIMRVVEAGGTSRGLYIFNEGGNIATQLAVLKEGGGGRIVAYPGNGGVAHAGIAYFKDGPGYEATWGNGKLMAQIASKGFIFYNESGTAVAKLGSSDGGSGYFSLGNKSGDSIVEAGLLDGTGIVRAFPCCGPPPVPIPSFIIGRKEK